MSSEIFVCQNSFVYEVDGVPGVVHRGATVHKGHPILEGHEDMFTPLVVDYEWIEKVEEPAEAPELPPLTLERAAKPRARR